MKENPAPLDEKTRVIDNFPKNKQSKLFTEINSYLNNRELMFYQKRNGDCDYEYYVKRIH